MRHDYEWLVENIKIAGSGKANMLNFAEEYAEHLDASRPANEMLPNELTQAALVAARKLIASKGELHYDQELYRAYITAIHAKEKA